MASNRKPTSGVSSKQTYGSAAHRILQAGLKDIMHWLPLAARRSCDDDGENVHHLRVGTRRAGVALKAFSDLADADKIELLRAKLRQVRKAADAARNLDVLTERFVTHAPESATASAVLRTKLLSRLCALRQDAQAPIVAIHHELADGKWDAVKRTLLQELKTAHPKRAAKEFGKQACGVLKPALKSFFKAADGDMDDDPSVHRLRIEAKKLRYTMEIVAAAFSPEFSGKLYERFCKYQDILGGIRDHVIAIELLNEWLKQPCDASERAFFQGLLVSEMRAHGELKEAFKALWTNKTIQRLSDKFERYTKCD